MHEGMVDNTTQPCNADMINWIRQPIAEALGILSFKGVIYPHSEETAGCEGRRGGHLR